MKPKKIRRVVLGEGYYDQDVNRWAAIFDRTLANLISLSGKKIEGKRVRRSARR